MAWVPYSWKCSIQGWLNSEELLRERFKFNRRDALQRASIYGAFPVCCPVLFPYNITREVVSSPLFQKWGSQIWVITWIVQGHLPTEGLIWEVNPGFWFHMLCQPAVLVYLIFSWPLISVSSALSFGLLPKSSSLIAQLSTVPICIPQILWWITTASRFVMVCNSSR